MTSINELIGHGFFEAYQALKITVKGRLAGNQPDNVIFSSPVIIFLQKLLPRRAFVRLYDQKQIEIILLVNFEKLSTRWFKV